MRISKKIIRILSSTVISDHWKEKALLRYAGVLMLNSMILLLMIAGCVLMVGGFAWIADYYVEMRPTISDVFSSISGMILMLTISIPYIYFRQCHAE